MIISIYNRTLDLESLLESYVFQGKTIRRSILEVSAFKDGVDHMIRR